MSPNMACEGLVLGLAFRIYRHPDISLHEREKGTVDGGTVYEDFFDSGTIVMIRNMVVTSAEGLGDRAFLPACGKTGRYP